MVFHGKHCFVPGCNNSYRKNVIIAEEFCEKHKKEKEFCRCDIVRFHNFPKNEILKNIWIDKINRLDKPFPSKWAVVCSAHFEGKYTPGDVPTKNLDLKKPVKEKPPKKPKKEKKEKPPGDAEAGSSGLGAALVVPVIQNSPAGIIPKPASFFNSINSNAGASVARYPSGIPKSGPDMEIDRYASVKPSMDMDIDRYPSGLPKSGIALSMDRFAAVEKSERDNSISSTNNSTSLTNNGNDYN